MNRPNLIGLTYVIAALSIASITTLSSVANVVAQANTTDTNTTAGAADNTTGTQESGAQFSTNLTGELAFPPVVTNATGTGEFTVVGDGNSMRYIIDAKNIDKVTDVFVAASSGGRYVDLVQLRSAVNEGVSGPISGTLAEGNFTSSDFTGRLNVDPMSDLLKLMIDGNAYIRVQTTDEPLGKIVGKIIPNLPS